MDDIDQAIERLKDIRAMGVKLAIDDFGTGYSSLAYLKNMPVDRLKIDQSFVRDIVSSPDDRLIVKATIELAHTLNLKVIAEGVESVEVYDLLAEMNCDYAQGFFISHPIEADQVAAWYQAKQVPARINR